MTEFRIDIEDSSGNKLGSGPLASVSRWRYTARFDRAGSIDFAYAANDPQADQVTNRRIARAHALLDGVWVEVGAGRIDSIDTAPGNDGRVSLNASGLDLIAELGDRSVGDLEVGLGSGATHSAALTAVGALAPAGWTFTPATSPDNDYIYARYGGESVLGALVHLAERTQTHFYRSSGRTLVFTSSFESSGVRAIQATGDLVAETCAIVSLRRTVDTHDLLTRITPFGSGQGAARLTLAATNRVAPTGYTLNAAENYIEADAAKVTYGLVDHPEVEFKEITPISNTDADLQAAANMLFDAALEELKRRSTLADQETYSLSIAGCSQLLRPMQTIRLVYRDVDQGIDIDDDLFILEATWEIDESGVRTSQLVVSTQDRWPESDASAAAERAVSGRVFQAHPQLNANSYVTAYTKNVDEDNIAAFRFRFGDEVVSLQQVLFEFQILPFESTVKSVGGDTSGSGDIPTSAPNIDTTGTGGNNETGSGGPITTDSSTPTVGSATPAIGSTTPAIGDATPAIGNATPGMGSSTPTIGSETPTIGSTTPIIGSVTPTIGNEQPQIFGVALATNTVSLTSAVSSLSGTGSGGPTSTDSSTPTIGSSTPTIGNATPTIGGSVPNIGNASLTISNTTPIIGNSSPDIGPPNVALEAQGRELDTIGTGLNTNGPEGGDIVGAGRHTHNLTVELGGTGSTVLLDTSGGTPVLRASNGGVVLSNTIGAHGDHTHGVDSHTHSINIHTHGIASHTHTITQHDHTIAIHNHTISAHNHTIASHDHTIAIHTHTIASHNHTIAAHTHTITAHTHDLSQHSHTIAAHTHNIGIHAHTIAAHAHTIAIHDHTISPHNHTIAIHSHTIASHNHTISAHAHTIAAHNHTISSHNHTIASHNHTITAHTHTLTAHTHSMAQHTHTLNNHTHNLSESIVAVYGIFREELVNTYALADLDYRVNGGTWFNAEDDAVDVSSGWWQIDITTLVMAAVTFRPNQANNLLEIRSLTIDKTATIDAQLSVRNIIQAIAFI